MERRRWAILYENGRVVRDTDEEGYVTLLVPRAWFNAPTDGVQAIAIEQESTGRAMFHGPDFYFCRPVVKEGEHPNLVDGVVGAADSLGPFLRNTGLVKYGAWVDEQHFFKVLKDFREGVDYPPVLTPDERTPWKTLVGD